MIRARANVNWAGHPEGEIQEVDETDPDIRARLGSGLLTRVDQPTRVFCLECSVPAFFDDAAALAAHRAETHNEGVGIDRRTEG